MARLQWYANIWMQNYTLQF